MGRHGVYIHIGVGFCVARFGKMGNAKASNRGTSNRYRLLRFFGVSRNSVGKRFHATPLICCDRFEIHRNKGLSVRRQNSSAL